MRALRADRLREVASLVGRLQPGRAAVDRVGGARQQAGISQVGDRAGEQGRVEPLSLCDLGEPDRPLAHGREQDRNAGRRELGGDAGLGGPQRSREAAEHHTQALSRVDLKCWRHFPP
jgi:hypothetical protein